MNAKSDNLDPGLTSIPQRSTAHARGTEMMAEDIVVTLRSRANSEVLGPAELQAELLKIGLHHDLTVLRELYQVVIPKVLL